MEFLLLLVVWLFIGCGIAWIMGGMATMGEPPTRDRSEDHR